MTEKKFCNAECDNEECEYHPMSIKNIPADELSNVKLIIEDLKDSPLCAGDCEFMLTPKGIFYLSLYKANLNLDEEKIEELWSIFVSSMQEGGYIEDCE